MTSKERMDSWKELFATCSNGKAEPKPAWETWKRILRMPHIDHDPTPAKEQWEKIVENHKRKQREFADNIIFKV